MKKTLTHFEKVEIFLNSDVISVEEITASPDCTIAGLKRTKTFFDVSVEQIFEDYKKSMIKQNMVIENEWIDKKKEVANIIVSYEDIVQCIFIRKTSINPKAKDEIKKKLEENKSKSKK